MACLGLQKGLCEEESLEICFELRHSGEISQTGRQQIPDRWSDETEPATTKRLIIINNTEHTDKRFFSE